MKNQSILYTLVLLLVSGPGATAAVEYEGYTNPAGDAFPIAIYDNVAISSPAGVQILSDAEQKAYFDTIRMAGFNVELWGKEDIWRKGPINKWGPYLKSLGMNTIISTRGYSLTRSRIPYDANTPDSILLQPNWNGLRTVISNYSQDPNVWGYWACDEPGMINLHKPVYELNPYDVAVIPTFNRIHRFRGDKIAYANMAVSYDQSYIGNFATDNPDNSDAENYKNYLDHMVDALDLKFLTFDLYQVIHNENSYGAGSGWVIKPFYYNSMDLYGRYCRDRKIPVWLVMLSVEHSNYYPDGKLEWEYPEISEGFLRMQAMNGLAFGMKGIVYWEYGAQNKMSGNTLYKSALYDINKMATTPAWAAARSVNNVVAQYGACLQNATYDRSCIAVKDSVNRYDGFEELSGSFHGINLIDHSGYAVLLSHLTSDDREYVAIVNQDHLKSQRITLALPQNLKYERVMLHYTADPNSVSLIDKDLSKQETFTLGPGAMILFSRTNK